MSAATAADIKAAFQVFDKDGSGTLSADEVAAILTRPTPGGTPMDLAKAHEYIARFDVNGDGVLSYDEFANAWATRSKPAETGAFDLHQVVTNAAPSSSKVEASGSTITVTAAHFVASITSPADGESCPDDVADATASLMDEVDDIDEVTPEALPGGEGWVLTATAESGKFYVRSRRNISGTTVGIRADAESEDRMTAAAAFCRALRAA